MFYFYKVIRSDGKFLADQREYRGESCWSQSKGKIWQSIKYAEKAQRKMGGRIVEYASDCGKILT